MDRLTANILKATSGENEAVENEVLTLGERLFQDLTKPHGFSPGIAVDPNNPTMLVLRLESSAPGCRWLLDRWADLRSMLEQEQPWQSHDKLRAIRLLGRQPLDALDDSQVAKVFLACHTIDSSGGELLHELWSELTPDELQVARQRFAGRPLRVVATPRSNRGARRWFKSSIGPWAGWNQKPTYICDAPSATLPPRRTDWHLTTVWKASGFAIMSRRAIEP